MRRFLTVLVLAFGVVAPGVAMAQSAPQGAEAEAKAQQDDQAQIDQQVKSGQVVKGKFATAPRGRRGSGFWTSNVPTPNHPYRWKYMAVGMGVCSAMGVLVLVLIRRAIHQREEARRS